MYNKEYHRAYYLNNKEKIKAKSARNYRSNVERHCQQARRNNLRRLFNLTEEGYEIMLEEQAYSCAICKTHISKLKKRLFVDHDHSNGMVRGLLCAKCNFGISHFNDDEEVLMEAIEYLRVHRKAR